MCTKILKSSKDTLSEKYLKSPDGVSCITDQNVVSKVKFLALKWKKSFSPADV